MDPVQVVVDGGRVVSWATMRGTHKGTWQGVPPTGLEVTIRTVVLHRVEEGRRVATRRKAKRTSSERPRRRGRIEFNHAMIYTTQLPRALRFYRDALGFQVVDDYPGAYARMKSPGGGTTIALHVMESGKELDTAKEGLRLYFEVERLDAFCEALMKKGVAIDQMPKDMPWGWRHAYLRDPDGHEISLYRAGRARLRRTVMRSEEP